MNADQIKYQIELSRKLCGCYACCGHGYVGGQLAAGAAPRVVSPIRPSSCLAAQVFVELSKPVLTAGRLAEFAKINADLERASVLLEAIPADGEERKRGAEMLDVLVREINNTRSLCCSCGQYEKFRDDLTDIIRDFS